MQLYSLVITALLAAAPMLAHARCNFDPACTIGPNQRCPTGCSRTEFCTKTTTRTLSASTVTSTLPASTITSTLSASTITSTVTYTGTITRTRTRTITVTPSAVTTTNTITVTQNASTITVTASTTSTTPPACQTEVPYANLFTFPDNTCKNGTNPLLGNPSLPLTIRGLVGPPIKFSNLTVNATSKYNESSCITLPTTNGGARSIYFTVDGIPENPYPSCTMNLYKDDQCQGNGSNSPARFITNQANTCQAANADRGSWKSVQFKCAYTRDLCTESEIALGLCIKY